METPATSYSQKKTEKSKKTRRRTPEEATAWKEPIKRGKPLTFHGKQRNQDTELILTNLYPDYRARAQAERTIRK